MSTGEKVRGGDVIKERDMKLDRLSQANLLRLPLRCPFTVVVNSIVYSARCDASAPEHDVPERLFMTIGARGNVDRSLVRSLLFGEPAQRKKIRFYRFLC